MIETAHEKTYFGFNVVLYFDEGTPFPWMFGIVLENGTLLRFLGIPNKCETKRQALKRAWYRCKWKRIGTYDKALPIGEIMTPQEIREIQVPSMGWIAQIRSALRLFREFVAQFAEFVNLKSLDLYKPAPVTLPTLPTFTLPTVPYMPSYTNTPTPIIFSETAPLKLPVTLCQSTFSTDLDKA